MTVYKQGRRKTFLYDFQYEGRRYRGNTKQTTKVDAERVEAKLKEKLRHAAGGILVRTREDSPRFQDWAEVFYAYKAARLAAPQAISDLIPVLLRFWGARPAAHAIDGEPYHDLRLCDPVTDPSWILQFEAWMVARGIGAQSRNHYRGIMRRMYQVALLPEYRQDTGVQWNPFAGVPNDPTFERTVTLEPAQLRAWMSHASYHVRLATAIAALAPKLRLANVLALRWDTSFEPDPRATKFDPRVEYFLTVARHKTSRRLRRPLVSPVTAPLLRILRDAWRRQPSAAYVVTYQGRPLKGITDGVAAAVTAAGLPYGRDRDGGVTFHTIRHTAATLLDGADPLMLRDVMGHIDLRTTLKYRHAKPRRQRPALEQLARTLQLEAAVTRKGTREARKRNTG